MPVFRIHGNTDAHGKEGLALDDDCFLEALEYLQRKLLNIEYPLYFADDDELSPASLYRSQFSP